MSGSPNALEIVSEWKDIARVAGCSLRTAQRHAMRDFDPLPVFVEGDKPCAYVRAILDWRARQRCSFRIYREVTMLRAELHKLRGKATKPRPAPRIARV